MSMEASAGEEKIFAFFINSRSYNVAFLKRYRFFLHLISLYCPQRLQFTSYQQGRRYFSEHSLSIAGHGWRRPALQCAPLGYHSSTKLLTNLLFVVFDA
jgi:hypothetical protein